MTDTLIVFCTCANRDEARRIAVATIEGRLAACANILSGVQSIFRWQEKLEEAEEVQLLIKTTAARYPALQARITELHSYDTPEIFAVPIAIGSEKYLAWLHDQTE